MTQQCSCKHWFRLVLNSYRRPYFPHFSSFQCSPYNTMICDCGALESKPLNLCTAFPFKEWVNTYRFSSKAHKNQASLKMFHRITEQLRSEGTCKDQPPYPKQGHQEEGTGLCPVGLWASLKALWTACSSVWPSSHYKNVFSCWSWIFYISTVAAVSHSVTGHHWEKSGSTFFGPSIEYLYTGIKPSWAYSPPGWSSPGTPGDSSCHKTLESLSHLQGPLHDSLQ